MNKLPMISFVLLLSIFMIYGNNIKWDEIPPDKISDYEPSEIEINKLNTEQLSNLNKDQIRYHLADIKSEQFGKMDSSEVGSLDESDAKKYFADKLSSGYSPKNPNERELLKKIKSYEDVNMNSFSDFDNVEFGKNEFGNYIDTPNGVVYLETPASVIQTTEGVVVDGNIRLTEGDLTVSTDSDGKKYYYPGLDTTCDLVRADGYTGVSIETDMEMPNIYPETDELKEGSVSFDENSLKAGGDGYIIHADENNGFENFVAKPEKGGVIKIKSPGVEEFRVDSTTISYTADPSGDDLVGESKLKRFPNVPFQNQKYITDDVTIVSEDGGTSFEKGGTISKVVAFMKGWSFGKDKDSDESNEITSKDPEVQKLVNDIEAGDNSVEYINHRIGAVYTTNAEIYMVNRETGEVTCIGCGSG
ncbi:MAG: hypothetical protein ACQESF_01800 [Nanobdellota archaeon]